MKNFLHILFTAIIALVVSTGCVRKDAVKLLGISDVNVSMQSSPTVSFVLNADNTSGRNITISNVSFEIQNVEEVRIARAIVCDDVFLAKRSVSAVTVPMKFTIDKPLKAFALLGDIEKSIKSLYISGSATIKAGCLKKTIRIDRMSATDFIERFGGLAALESNGLSLH